MLRVELRVEYTAQEISAQDFDWPTSAPNPNHIKGVVYRPETRTARLMTPQEYEDCSDDDDGEESGEQSYQAVTAKHPHSYDGRKTKTGGHPGPHSFYGIGCFIICKNGVAIDIINADRFREIYRLQSKG